MQKNNNTNEQILSRNKQQIVSGNVAQQVKG